MLRVGIWWGFDCLSCPMGGEFDFLKSQIPTFPPPLPGRGGVGHNIDRCIT